MDDKAFKARQRKERARVEELLLQDPRTLADLVVKLERQLDEAFEERDQVVERLQNQLFLAHERSTNGHKRLRRALVPGPWTKSREVEELLS